MTRKLHIGGVEVKPGWEIFNIAPGPGVDFVGNANDLSVFPDGTFDVVYASHVLEHFDYKNEISVTLKEWIRVIKPGGSILLSVPDLDILALLFTVKELSTKERFHIMRMIFGGHIDPYDYHSVGLNFEFLGYFLNEVGFTDIQRVKAHGLFNDTSDVQFKSMPISLNVRAKRPE